MREVLNAAAAGWAEFTPAQVDEIARTQFRSLWYVPLLARWLVDGRPVPSRTETLAHEAEPDSGVWRSWTTSATASWTSRPSSCRVTRRAAGVPVFDRETGVPPTYPAIRGWWTCRATSPGSSPAVPGYGFAELVIRGGSAARLFGLREGDALLARSAQPEPVLVA